MSWVRCVVSVDLLEIFYRWDWDESGCLGSDQSPDPLLVKFLRSSLSLQVGPNFWYSFLLRVSNEKPGLRRHRGPLKILKSKSPGRGGGD